MSHAEMETALLLGQQEFADTSAGFSALAEVDISSRRYLGGKRRIAPHIVKTLQDSGISFKSFADVFAGTGSVAHAFNTAQRKVIVNDHLFFNYVCLYAWFCSSGAQRALTESIIRAFNGMPVPRQENYFSRCYGDKYFSMATARKIGAIREEIESIQLGQAEKFILLASLIYATDKVAATCGHYDAFRQNVAKNQQEKLVLKMPQVSGSSNIGNEAFCENANSLAGRLDVDVLFLDPPYNSRQYCDAYHVLENLARWKKPPVYGEAAKMPRGTLKSRYCTKEAPDALRELIQGSHAKTIVMTYNNTGEKANPRSNAKISDNQLLPILKDVGKVTVIPVPHRPFSAGKSSRRDHQERIFICQVKS